MGGGRISPPRAAGPEEEEEQAAPGPPSPPPPPRRGLSLRGGRRAPGLPLTRGHRPLPALGLPARAQTRVSTFVTCEPAVCRPRGCAGQGGGS